ncbi:hypothetical protein [Lujinxingia litoralis]|nr:hypothetical protein [Lujinxingia litoralis]
MRKDALTLVAPFLMLFRVGAAGLVSPGARGLWCRLDVGVGR